MSDISIDIAPRTATPRRLSQGATVLTAGQAAWSRTLGRGQRLVLHHVGAQLHLLPLSTEDFSSEAAWLRLNTPFGELFIAGGARLLRLLTGLDGPDGAGAWPDWLVAAIAGRLSGCLLGTMRSAAIVAAPPSGLERACLELRGEEHGSSAVAVAAPGTWLALLAAHPGDPLRMAWKRWDALALDTRVVLGRHRLPMADVRALQMGDVIVPGWCRFNVAGDGRMALGSRCWRVRYLPEGALELIDEEQQMNAEMMEEEFEEQSQEVAEDGGGQEPTSDGAAPGPVTEDGATGFGAVAVSLRFELGRVRLSLAQLRALGPQCVLELLDGSPQSVGISCGAAEVGRGEVVDVEGRLGVRITDWSGAC